MKFKTIFVFFNIVIGASFVCIILMPFFMLGGGYVKVFWMANWYLAAVFIAALVALNIYFWKNKKLFSLLEDEDWKGVSSCLEERIYGKKKISRHTLRLLINTYVVLADTAALAKLSRYIEESSPRYFTIFALELGIPYMLQGSSSEMREYFDRALKRPAAGNRPWLLFYSAFAALRSASAESREQGASILLELASGGRDGVLRLLALYLLDSRAEKDGDDTVRRVRSELKGLHSRKDWEKLLERFVLTLNGLVLKRVLEDARNWFFKENGND